MTASTSIEKAIKAICGPHDREPFAAVIGIIRGGGEVSIQTICRMAVDDFHTTEAMAVMALARLLWTGVVGVRAEVRQNAARRSGTQTVTTYSIINYDVEQWFTRREQDKRTTKDVDAFVASLTKGTYPL